MVNATADRMIAAGTNVHWRMRVRRLVRALLTIGALSLGGLDLLRSRDQAVGRSTPQSEDFIPGILSNFLRSCHIWKCLSHHRVSLDLALRESSQVEIFCLLGVLVANIADPVLNNGGTRGLK